MILNEYVNIKITSKVFKYYKNLNYNCKMGEISVIKVTDLPKKSNVYVDCKCGNCNEIRKIKFIDYNKNISKYNLYYCRKCCGIKISATLKNSPIKKFSLENDINYTYLPIWKKRYIECSDNKQNYFDEIKANKKQSILNIQEKVKIAMNEKYGVSNAFLIPDIISKNMIYHKTYKKDLIEKRTITCNDKYGGHPMQNDKVKEKFVNTMNEKYGVSYSNQSENIFIKQQKAGFKLKYYNELTYQGTYELDFINYCEKISIIDKISNGLRFEYYFNNKKHIYFSDFYFKELNSIIEIKSTYYYNRFLEKNIAKKEECINKGYNYILILDKNYDEFFTLLNKKGI